MKGVTYSGITVKPMFNSGQAWQAAGRPGYLPVLHIPCLPSSSIFDGSGGSVFVAVV